MPWSFRSTNICKAFHIPEHLSDPPRTWFYRRTLQPDIRALERCCCIAIPPKLAERLDATILILKQQPPHARWFGFPGPARCYANNPLGPRARQLPGVPDIQICIHWVTARGFVIWLFDLQIHIPCAALMGASRVACDADYSHPWLLVQCVVPNARDEAFMLFDKRPELASMVESIQV
jgi:hypothetical protein